MTKHLDESFLNQDFTDKGLAKGEYEGCKFTGCNFASTTLSEIRFIDCEFVDCDLSNTNLHKTSFQDVLFKGCKMLGLAFDVCKPFNFSIKCEDSILNHSIFFQTKLTNSTFRNCQLRAVDFAESEMMGSDLSACDLLNATFDRTNLENADLRGAINYSINPNTNKLKGARFSAPEVLSLLDQYDLKIE